MEFVIGILIAGLLFWLFIVRKKPSGTFVIDTSDINKDLCTLELDENLNAIYSKKQITLRVKIIR